MMLAQKTASVARVRCAFSHHIWVRGHYCRTSSTGRWNLLKIHTFSDIVLQARAVCCGIRKRGPELAPQTPSTCSDGFIDRKPTVRAQPTGSCGCEWTDLPILTPVAKEALACFSRRWFMDSGLCSCKSKKTSIGEYRGCHTGGQGFTELEA